ncbi:hypothetical protein D1007_53104 [Hordeum vulgare]|nr:hypothetical protein D1007_53104 [Hordeum vulgare]
MVTASARHDVRRHSAEAEAAAIDLVAPEQQSSSLHPCVQREGCTGMASCFHARKERVIAHAALFLARVLLRYRLADADYNVWPTRLTQDNAAW